MWSFRRKPKEPEPFKVGEIVKCIDDREWNETKQTINLIFGKTYKILQVNKCSVCNTYSYDIGCRFDNKKSYTTCTPSNHDLPGMGIHMAGHFRFAKSVETEQSAEQSAKQINEEIAQCIVEEKFEKAAELKKKLEKAI